MQADVVVHLDEAVLLQPQCLAMLGVAVVGEGHDRVDAVVAAVQLDDHEHPSFALRCRGAGGPGQETGDGRRQGERGRMLQAITSGEHGYSPRFLLVPTLCVGTHVWTLCVLYRTYLNAPPWPGRDAERPGSHPHAERGDEEVIPHATWASGMARIRAAGEPVP